MEPPAKPRKPRRIKASQSSTNDQEAAENHDTNMPTTPPPAGPSEPPRPATKPKPRSRKPPTPVETIDDSDFTPVMSSPPPSILTPGLPSEEASESFAAESALDIESAIAPSDVPVTRAAAIEKIPQTPARNPLIGTLRILAVRNIEITRRYSGRAGQSSRQLAHSISQRVSSVQIGGKSIREAAQETGARLRTGPGNLLTRLQRNLEVSDAAVVTMTLFVIVVCVLLTLFGVYLWNRF